MIGLRFTDRGRGCQHRAPRDRPLSARIGLGSELTGRGASDYRRDARAAGPGVGDHCGQREPGTSPAARSRPGRPTALEPAPRSSGPLLFPDEPSRRRRNRLRLWRASRRSHLRAGRALPRPETLPQRRSAFGNRSRAARWSGRCLRCGGPVLPAAQWGGGPPRPVAVGTVHHPRTPALARLLLRPLRHPQWALLGGNGPELGTTC